MPISWFLWLARRQLLLRPVAQEPQTIQETQIHQDLVSAHITFTATVRRDSTPSINPDINKHMTGAIGMCNYKSAGHVHMRGFRESKQTRGSF